jgi:hypothetical protein
VLVWTKHEPHVYDTNQQVINTWPYWIAQNGDIPSGRTECTNRHSACRCSRPAGCSAERKAVRIRTPSSRREEEDKASSHVSTTLPKNVIAALHPSRWTQRRQAFRRPTLPVPVRAANRDGDGR